MLLIVRPRLNLGTLLTECSGAQLRSVFSSLFVCGSFLYVYATNSNKKSNRF